MKNSFIRILVKGTGLYLAYCCVCAIREENNAKQARKIRQQQLRYGGSVQLSPEKQQILDQADLYLQNHAGLKYLNRVKTKQLMETKIQEMIDERTEKYQKTKKENQNDPQLQQILNQIAQLNKAYAEVKPKYTKLSDLVEKDPQDDEYYQKQS